MSQPQTTQQKIAKHEARLSEIEEAISATLATGTQYGIGGRNKTNLSLDDLYKAKGIEENALKQLRGEGVIKISEGIPLL